MRLAISEPRRNRTLRFGDPAGRFAIVAGARPRRCRAPAARILRYMLIECVFVENVLGAEMCQSVIERHTVLARLAWSRV